MELIGVLKTFCILSQEPAKMYAKTCLFLSDLSTLHVKIHQLITKFEKSAHSSIIPN